MATINIGRIKFVWQGAYSNSTAYVPDDIVSYSGSSYVCTANTTGNLPTDTTYWSVMAQGGTDITSLAGLAQGDILYYNGSDWVKLGAGTNGQMLTTGGAGANPSWTTPSTGGAISTNQASINGMQTTTSTSYVSIGSGLSVTVTPSSTSSKFLLLFSSTMNGGGHYVATTAFRDSTNLASEVNASSIVMGWSDGTTAGWESGGWSYLDAPNTTSSITYEAKYKSGNGTTVYLGDGSAHIQTFQVIEL